MTTQFLMQLAYKRLKTLASNDDSTRAFIHRFVAEHQLPITLESKLWQYALLLRDYKPVERVPVAL